jgi:UDP-N-acetyl-D-glucosamine dehydrogenase
VLFVYFVVYSVSSREVTMANATVRGSSEQTMEALTIKEQFLVKLAQRTARLCIIGMGYVGLPLAVEFAKAGLRVTGLDVNATKCARLNRGESYIQDVPSEVVRELVEGQRLSAATDFAALDEADAAIICVPTPLNKTKDPDISYIVAAADQLAAHMHAGMLVVLESTTYPGTTEEVLQPRIVKNGYRVGEDFYLAFSPERVDPGNRTWHTRNTPKVVGA